MPSGHCIMWRGEEECMELKEEKGRQRQAVKCADGRA